MWKIGKRLDNRYEKMRKYRRQEHWKRTSLERKKKIATRAKDKIGGRTRGWWLAEGYVPSEVDAFIQFPELGVKGQYVSEAAPSAGTYHCSLPLQSL